MSESLERIERAFAGGVILAPAETDRLVEQVTARHFTEWRWGTIYDAAIRVYHQHPALAGDVSAVIAQLGADGELDRVGGSVAVLDLVHDACVGGSVSWYARRILDGTVAFGDRRACGIVDGDRIIQIASWSSSNAVANRNTGAASIPSS